MKQPFAHIASCNQRIRQGSGKSLPEVDRALIAGNRNGFRVSRFTSTTDTLDYNAAWDLDSRVPHRRLSMATLARALTRALPRNSVDIQFLNELVLFCTAGLYVSLLMIKYGIDLSYGPF